MVSDPVNTKLASLNDKLVKTSLSEEKTKWKHEKYNRPENCNNLIRTRVNTEIWSKVISNTWPRDLRMQKLEANLLRSMIPIVKVADKLLELRSNSKSARESYVHDSINEVINLKQRELIKPDLNGDLNDQLKQICSSQNPVTKVLFGDDLPKSVKEINETNWVDVKVSSKYPSTIPQTFKKAELSSSLAQSES